MTAIREPVKLPDSLCNIGRMEIPRPQFEGLQFITTRGRQGFYMVNNSFVKFTFISSVFSSAIKGLLPKNASTWGCENTARMGRKLAPYFGRVPVKFVI